VEWPVVHAPTFRTLALEPARGFLLAGPPGCSKTSLARALASGFSCSSSSPHSLTLFRGDARVEQSNQLPHGVKAANHSSAQTSHPRPMSFFYLDAAMVYSPYLGQAEATVRHTFDQARKSRPALIFIDEIDTIAPKRGHGQPQDTQSHASADSSMQSRVLATLLNEMDGIEQCEGIFLLAATNRPEALDPALLRPQRLEQIIYVPLPDAADREAILRVHTKHMPLAEEVDLHCLAAQVLLPVLLPLLTSFFAGVVAGRLMAFLGRTCSNCARRLH
jgi:SpoVK/Ycf46/Vps4 family AAA+-type ATPase